MILLQIDSESVAVAEFKCDAPWPVHMQGVARRLEALQGVEIKTGDVQILQSPGAVQNVEPPQAAIMQWLLHRSSPARLGKNAQPFVSETPDHKIDM